MMKMNFCSPELPVKDIEAAMTNLRSLGFKDGWTYEGVFACMFGDGDIEIFLRKSEQPTPVVLYFKVDDAEAFYEKYQKHAEIVSPLHDTSWGMREFEGRVLDGHIFRIGNGTSSEDRREPAT